MHLRISGKVAVVSDVSKGIGLAIARQPATERCSLALCARDTASSNGASGVPAGGARVG